MILEKILYVAVFINLAGTFYYCRDILRGHTKPNLVTWFFWALMPFIGVFFQLKAGAGLSVLPILVDGLNCVIIISFSLWHRHSYWQLGKLDLVCGILATLAVAIYILTHNLGVSILFAILADFFPSIPTTIKAWKFPETETGTIYIIAAATNFIGIAIIKNWTFTIYSFGMYFAVMNLIIAFCVYRKKIFKSKV